MATKHTPPRGPSPGDDVLHTSAVRVRRRDLRITQAELAQLVGVSRQTIVAVEQGDYAPSVFLALKIGSALGATVEELFSPTDQPHSPSTEREQR